MGCTARVLVYASGGAEHSDIAPTLVANGFDARFVAPDAPANDSQTTGDADVVIIDCQDLVSDQGAAAIDLARSLTHTQGGRRVPVIVIDSSDDSARQLKILSAGADEYIARPFQESQLLGRLGSHLRLATMREELLRRAETANKYGIEQVTVASPEEFDGVVQLLVVGGRGDSFAAMESSMGADTDLTFAWSGQTALDYLQRRSFDAVLIDMESRDGEPLRLCSQIRAHPSLANLPILIFGDRVGLEDPAETVRSGADEVLFRPLGNDELRTRIRALVTQQRYRAELYRIYSEARHPLVTDSLTGLYTHGYLMEHLGTQIEHAVSHNRNLSLVLFDVHKMRVINHQYGYATGDRVIRQIGSLFSRLVRGEDLPARYAGGSFCVVLPDTSERDSGVVVSRLQNIVNYTEFAGSTPDEPCSVRLKGTAIQLAEGDTPASFIERARQALIDESNNG